MTSTLRSALMELGYGTPKQQRAFVKLAHMAGCFGEIPVPGMLTDEQADKVLSAVTFDSAKDAAEWLHDSTQRFMIRRPLGKERVDAEEPERYKTFRTGMLAALDDIGALAPVMPKEKHYNHVLVLGAMEEGVDGRLNTLKNLYDRGVRFDDIALLGTQRPLMPEHEPSAATLPQSGLPVTETGMMQQKYFAQSESWPEELQQVRAVMIDTFMKPCGARPNTKDTVESWLKTNPSPGNVLVISSQPYVDYQDAAVNAALPPGFTTDTVGAPAHGDCVKISVALDSLARHIDVGLPKLMERLKSAEAAELVQDHVQMVDPTTLVAMPELFQYRSGGDAKTGTVEDHKRGGEWDPNIDGQVITAMMYEGRPVIVNGHHRAEKAQALRAQGRGPAQVPVRYLHDCTVAEARMIGAFQNFIDEFKESSEPKSEQDMIDAARIFHDISEGRVRRDKVPVIRMSEDLKLAQSAGSLSDKAFALVENGNVPIDAAAEIATRVHDPERQYHAMQLIRHRLPPEPEKAPEPVAPSLKTPEEKPASASIGVWTKRIQQQSGQGAVMTV